MKNKTPPLICTIEFTEHEINQLRSIMQYYIDSLFGELKTDTEAIAVANEFLVSTER